MFTGRVLENKNKSMKEKILKEFEELFANYTSSQVEKQIFIDFIEKVYEEGYEDCRFVNDLN